MTDVEKFIEEIYLEATAPGCPDFSAVPNQVKEKLSKIARCAESSKGVLAVTLTSLLYKCLHPEQDVRRHQTSIEGGYSGRTFDGHYVTPFLRAKNFPCMAESGWLTRSLEQKVPYDFDYTGAITPKSLKEAFLGVLDDIEKQAVDLRAAARYLIWELATIRDSRHISMARPKNLSISAIMNVLAMHFGHSYHSRGAARLPVLAMYAVYQILTQEMRRYKGMTLLPLERHTSADTRSGRLGDIDIVDHEGNPFESVEIKFGVAVGKEVVDRAKNKIFPTPVSRYYILSTSQVEARDREYVEAALQQVKNCHGCQIVVNGIMPTLKYYLRLLEDPTQFTEKYADLLAADEAIKFEHKQQWNKIIASL